MKNIIIERDNIIGEVNKILESSKGMKKFIRALKLTLIIQEEFSKKML